MQLVGRAELGLMAAHAGEFRSRNCAVLRRTGFDPLPRSGAGASSRVETGRLPLAYGQRYMAEMEVRRQSTSSPACAKTDHSGFLAAATTPSRPWRALDLGMERDFVVATRP